MQLSVKLCSWLSALSANRKIFTPLNYSILHDFAHAKIFSLSKRDIPDILKNKPNMSLPYPHANNTFREVGSDLNVLVLCQQLNANYIFPVLQFLGSKHFKSQYSQARVSFEFLTLDPQSFRAKHQLHIEKNIRDCCTDSQEIFFKYTDFSKVIDHWMPSSTYFDNIFEIPSQIVPVADVEKEDADMFSDIISTNLVIYESALSYLSKNKVSFVVTANDQWYPTSSVFAAACDLSIPTLLAYHGTMPKFAEYTFADQIFFYEPVFYSKKTPASQPRYRDFDLPLDLFISKSKNVEPLGLLQKPSGGTRLSTLGIVSALNGDMIYGISDYKQSFDNIIKAISSLKSASDSLLQSIILRAHPHQNASSKALINDAFEKLTQMGLKCVLDDSNTFLEFVSRCGPIAACPSTALDSLLYYNYPILVSSTSELMDIVFGRQLYDNCSIPVCSHEDEILATLKGWFES